MVELCQREWFASIIDKRSDAIFLCLARFFIVMAVTACAAFWMIMMVMMLMLVLMLVMMLVLVFVLMFVIVLMEFRHGATSENS